MSKSNKSKNNTANLLVDDYPMLVFPALAHRIGPDAAIVLQQLNFWLNNFELAGNEKMNREGRWWVFNTVKDWQTKQFTWWSVRKVEVILQDLEKMGLVTTKKFYSYKWDQKKWYTVNHDAVLALAQLDIAFVDWKMPELVKHLADALGGRKSLKARKTASNKICSIKETENGHSEDQKMVDDIEETKKKKLKEETKEYIKAPGRAENNNSNFETSSTNNEPGGEHSGTVSGQNQQDNDGCETHETQNETDPYAKPWCSKIESFRQDKNGWAVLPQFPKHKLANFMATRAMQLELLYELDDEFSAEWLEADSQLWVTTTHAGTGLEDDILGTVETAGANWVEYDDEEDNYCHPGAASIRVLRDWGYSQGKLSQSWFNERLKELWDESVLFCNAHGDNAKFLFKSRPVWESLSIDIDLE